MTPQTYIFMGRSGCGKGTQAGLLEKLLENKKEKLPTVHLETGKLFRDFIKGATHTQEVSKTILESGGLQPEFLTVYLWSAFMVMNMRKDCHLIVDGTPRRRDEAAVLHTAFEFYMRTNPHIIYLDVSRTWSEKHMLERKRQDDNKRDIELRLNWFDTDVAPAIEYYRNNPFYSFHSVNGERAIEEIHADIVKILGLG
ncbi:MAG: nucleoside monophosphate kinase [Candidatus Paceibacterota bacterium]|jgi:adenylate kinase